MKIGKPWGSEEILECNDKYVLKRLFMKNGHKCSLQYHNKKHETIYLIFGELLLHIANSNGEIDIVKMFPGEYKAIPPNIVHRMEGQTDCIYLESSTPELDDVVRIQDDYSRK